MKFCVVTVKTLATDSHSAYLSYCPHKFAGGHMNPLAVVDTQIPPLGLGSNKTAIINSWEPEGIPVDKCVTNAKL